MTHNGLLPDNVRRLILSKIDSVWHLEILLYSHARHPQFVSLTEASKALRLEEEPLLSNCVNCSRVGSWRSALTAGRTSRISPPSNETKPSRHLLGLTKIARSRSSALSTRGRQKKCAYSPTHSASSAKFAVFVNDSIAGCCFSRESGQFL